MLLARDKIARLSAKVGQETCTIRATPEHCWELALWCDALRLEFRGTGLAGTSFWAIQEMLRKKRLASPVLVPAGKNEQICPVSCLSVTL